MFGPIADVLVQAFGLTQTWINNYLVSPFITFTRGFEFAIVFAAAVLFCAISVFLLLRQAKRLPTAYRIDVTDLFDQQISIDGLRIFFSTHDAAESYARMYRQNFGTQYNFRVVGLKSPHGRSELRH